ncbi:MAG: hypothetical protein ACKVGW_07500, partial [Verrucomicrobiia bacterium]
EREGSFGIFSSRRAINVYNDVLSKALIKLIAELNEHFEMDFGYAEPDGDIQSLSPSLGTPIDDK